MEENPINIFKTQKGGECMTGKEIVNLIRVLREKGMSAEEILEIIERVETHAPAENSAQV